MKTTVVLFGGHGYIGRHLWAELLARGHRVLVPDQLGTWVKLCLERPTVDMIHLACPRKSNWDIERACDGLEKGLALSQALPPGRRLFLSTMSVHDDRLRDYATFKRTAEVAARNCGFGIIRLATVLGGKYCYRGDLGLHRVAKSLAMTSKAWVNAHVERNTMTIHQAVAEILKFPEFKECEGLVKYKDIVPDEVEVRDPGHADTYCAEFGAPLDETGVIHLKQEFKRLVDRIKQGLEEV